jgi:hypothetical protein
MGLGCVIIAWTVLGGMAAAVASVVLALITRRLVPPRPKRWRWIAAAAAVPFALLAYGVVAFLGYAAWCESRNVDPGLGDEWRVPLTGGYSLVMVDTFDQPFIEQPSDRDGNLSVSSISVAGRFIVADDRAGPFMIDTATGALQRFASRADLDRELKRRGERPARLQSPRDFYSEHRWTRVDAAAGLVLAIIPIALLLLAGARLRRSRRN